MTDKWIDRQMDRETGMQTITQQTNRQKTDIDSLSYMNSLKRQMDKQTNCWKGSLFDIRQTNRLQLNK